jgi:hypothetical protein
MKSFANHHNKDDFLDFYNFFQHFLSKLFCAESSTILIILSLQYLQATYFD